MADERKSIIGKKYGKGYRGAEDWCRDFIDEQVKVAKTSTKEVKNEETGEVTTETRELKGKVLDIDKLLGLARVNNLDEGAIANLEKQKDKRNAPGRIRMSIGNMLRAAAKKRHGLYDLDGEWTDAPTDFVGETERTEERDGKTIAKAPAQEAPAEEPAEEAAEA